MPGRGFEQAAPAEHYGQAFTSGLHTAVLTAGAVTLVAAVLALAQIRARRSHMRRDG